MELGALAAVYRHGLHAVPRMHPEYLMIRTLENVVGIGIDGLHLIYEKLSFCNGLLLF